MSERNYKIIDMDKVNKRIEEGEILDEEKDDLPPHEVLYETLLDLLQLSEAEGLSEEIVDDVLRRVTDYRAERNRKRFRLHAPE